MSILDKAQIPIKCGHCEFVNTILIEQIRTRKTIICRGCRSSILLADHLKSVQKAEREVTGDLNNLKNAVGKNFNFEIKL
jgi:hypothetical protein